MGLGAFIGKTIGKTSLAQGILKGAISSNTNLVNSLPYSSTYIPKGRATWTDLTEAIYLLECYEKNFVVQAVINIKAEALANIRFKVKDLKTEEETPLTQYTKDGGKLNDLISQPNPMQSTYEWLLQAKLYFEIFNNSYNYASIPFGFKFRSYQDINVINNLPSYLIEPILTGNWLESTEIDEIIQAYEFKSFNNSKKELPTKHVMHLNSPNIRLDQNFTEGVSDLVALRDPISNITKAYEARNILINRRGPEGIFSSNKQDAVSGSVALTKAEKDVVQKEMEGYGMLEGQYRHILTSSALTYQKTGFNVKDLMLFEEVSHDALAICNAKGVPEDLVRYYIKTGGLSNENNTSEKRLYDSTIIPESQRFMRLLNNFLKTKEAGIELIGSYDHVKVLQANKKEEAEVQKINTESAKSNFMSGLTTYGQYAIASGVELEDKSLEKNRIWDLDEKQLNAIGINNKKESNGTADE